MTPEVDQDTVAAGPVTATTLGDLLDAVKELTKKLGDNTKEIGILREEQEELSKQIELSRKAGKF